MEGVNGEGVEEFVGEDEGGVLSICRVLRSVEKIEKGMGG